MRTFWTKTKHLSKNSLGLYFGWGPNSFWCSLSSFFLKKLTKILAHKASYYASTCWWFIKTKLDKVIEKNVSSLWFTILVSQRQINLVWPIFLFLTNKRNKTSFKWKSMYAEGKYKSTKLYLTKLYQQKLSNHNLRLRCPLLIGIISIMTFKGRKHLKWIYEWDSVGIPCTCWGDCLLASWIMLLQEWENGAQRNSAYTPLSGNSIWVVLTEV